MPTNLHRHVRALLGVGLLVVVPAACSSGEDAASAPDDLEAYCSGSIVLDHRFQNFDAEDFTFDGTFPSEAGQVSFDMTNVGEEAHALIVARKLDDVEGSALDAFNALESEEDFPTVFEQAVSVFAEPGDQAHGLAELEPGSYVVFCPIPNGTTGEESVGDGPPHFTAGMVTAFEVP